ncbi:MAG: ribosomal protein [Candidatus Parcubacteria bacterium]|jgi:large subunit ribosomal protein L18
MEKTQAKHAKRAVRHNRIRAKVTGTTDRPRLAIFKSNRFVYAQLIDDTKGVTVAAADSRAFKGTMTEGAVAVGADIAKKATAKGVTAVVFDRGGFKYQGLIAALADSARSNGLTF